MAECKAMNILSRAILIFAYAYSVGAYAFPTAEIVGDWSGEAITSYFRVRKTIPDYYRVTTMSMRIGSNSRVTGKTGDGCVFEGRAMRTSTLTFPITGLIINCPHERMNGSFEGVINFKGETKLLIRDKALGRTDIYGHLSRHSIREINNDQ